MTTVIKKLVTEFRYKFNDKGLKKAEKGLNEFKKRTFEIFGAVAVALSGGAFISKIAETTDRLGKMADSLGLPVKTLQTLEFAAERAGVPVSSLITSFQNLNRAVGQAAHGQGAFWTDINARQIDIHRADGTMKSTLEVFHTLNQAFQTISKQQQFDVAASLGINPQTIPLLQQTSKSLQNVEEQAKALGLVSRKETIRAAKFEDAWTNIKMSLYALSVQIFSFVEPSLQFLASTFTKMLRVIRTNKIANFAMKLGVMLTAIVAVRSVLPLLTLVVGEFAAVLDILLSPVTLIVAGLVLLGLIVQDVWGYFHGMKSVTGELIASFHKWPKPLQYVVVVIALVIDAFKGLWNGAKKYTGLVAKGFEYLWDKIKAVGKAIGHFFSALYHFVVPKWMQKLFAMVGKKLSIGAEFRHTTDGKTAKKVAKKDNIFTRELASLDKASIAESKRAIYKKPAVAHKLHHVVHRIPKVVVQKLQQVVPVAQKLQRAIPAVQPIPNVVSSKHIATKTINNKTVNVSLGNVNVSAQTNASPQDIAQHVNNVVAEKLKSSVGYFDSGVIR